LAKVLRFLNVVPSAHVLTADSLTSSRRFTVSFAFVFWCNQYVGPLLKGLLIFSSFVALVVNVRCTDYGLAIIRQYRPARTATTSLPIAA
jgi:hypothetical protein